MSSCVVSSLAQGLRRAHDLLRAAADSLRTAADLVGLADASEWVSPAAGLYKQWASDERDRCLAAAALADEAAALMLTYRCQVPVQEV
jgi:hypothetical protein